MSVTRYASRFLNALMDSHHIYIRAELWYANALVGPLNVVSGSVSADRNSAVRRTANLTIDPTAITDATLGPKLNPYGSEVKCWRGVRYPDNTVEQYQIFTGRIDSIDKAIDGVSLRCSDRAATVVDARFTSPRTLPYGQNLNDVAKSLIQECFGTPPPGVLYDTATSVLTVSGMTYEQERGDALDAIMGQIGSEWFCTPDGIFHLRALPAVITANTLPVWIVDSGDSGVLVSSGVGIDRQNVANQVVVDGEAVGGPVGAHGYWEDSDSSSVTWVGGAYGKVAAFYSGQAVNSTDAANALAKSLGANSIAKVAQVNVSCVVNPSLNLGDVIRVFQPRLQLDKMYFVQSMEIPLDPESAMTMNLYQTLIASGTSTFAASPLRIPQGATWQPHP